MLADRFIDNLQMNKIMTMNELGMARKEIFDTYSIYTFYDRSKLIENNDGFKVVI